MKEKTICVLSVSEQLGSSLRFLYVAFVKTQKNNYIHDRNLKKVFIPHNLIFIF